MRRNGAKCVQKSNHVFIFPLNPFAKTFSLFCIKKVSFTLKHRMHKKGMCLGALQTYRCDQSEALWAVHFHSIWLLNCRDTAFCCISTFLFESYWIYMRITSLLILCAWLTHCSFLVGWHLSPGIISASSLLRPSFMLANEGNKSVWSQGVWKCKPRTMQSQVSPATCTPLQTFSTRPSKRPTTIFPSSSQPCKSTRLVHQVESLTTAALKCISSCDACYFAYLTQN